MLTGKIKFISSNTTVFSKTRLILMVEENLTSTDNIGGYISDHEYTRWREAKTEDIPILVKMGTITNV